MREGIEIARMNRACLGEASERISSPPSTAATAAAATVTLELEDLPLKGGVLLQCGCVGILKLVEVERTQ